MRNERRTKAIILKKQPFGEQDEIITFFTEHYGKIRLLAKSTKRPSSHLQYALQGFSEVEIQYQKGSSSIPRLIQVVPVRLFSNIYEHEQKLLFLFWLAELTLKATPDEQENSTLYVLLREVIACVAQTNPTQGFLDTLMVKTMLESLDVIGLSVNIPKNPVLYFSNAGGGFTAEKTSDAVQVSREVFESLSVIASTPLTNISILPPTHEGVKFLMQGFLHYQIERVINSERFLNKSGA